jgi:hypothetical protein
MPKRFGFLRAFLIYNSADFLKEAHIALHKILRGKREQHSMGK